MGDVVPSHEEFQQASLRVRARQWWQRARIVSAESEAPPVLHGDNRERELADLAICERWYERYGY